MLNWLAKALVDHPEIAVFLALAVGFWIGRFTYRGLGLGAVTGTLLAGVVIGAVVEVDVDGTATNIVVADETKQIFFLLFLFALGYRLGPQFFSGLKGSGAPQAVFAVLLIVIGLGVTVGLSIALGYNPGLGAGLAAGGLTQSSIIGVAQDSISGLSENADTLSEWSDLVSVGYAVTYIFGTIGAAIYCANIAPRLLGIKDLPAAAKAKEAELGFAEEETDVVMADHPFVRRAFAVGAALPHATVGELETQLGADTGDRVFIDRVRAGGDVVTSETDTAIAAGDVVVLSSRKKALFDAADELALSEVDDAELLAFPVEELSVVVTNGQVAGHTVEELRADPAGRGVFMSRLRRAGQDIPIGPGTELHRGDEMTIQGPKWLVERAISHIGYPERSTPMTDMVTVGLGITIGALLGLPSITAGTVPLSLTSSVGALLLGLVIGWRRMFSPTFGRIPPGAQWFFETVGLTAFVAVVGVNSGPGFVDGLSEYGIGLFFAGVVVTLAPLVLSTYIARYVFKFDPVLILGMLTGAQTTTAAVGSVKEAAGSSVPLLGFTVPYAIGNIFLSIGGAIVVAFLA